MLFSSLEHSTDREDVGTSLGYDELSSLAGPFLVRVDESPTNPALGSERWSLVPIDQVSDHDTPDGAQSIAALQSSGFALQQSVDLLVLDCSYSNSQNSIRVTAAHRQQPESEKDRELLSVLARIMAQKVVATAATLEGAPLVLKLLEEDPIKIDDISCQQGLLELYAGIVGDTSNIELVEMVGCSPNGGMRILGVVPRSLVHTHNLLHRGIGLVITKDRPFDVSVGSANYPALYCHRRTDTKRIFPSLYDMFVGGVSAAGEDAFSTASREVAEELGLSRALTPNSPLSKPLFNCTVCTSYNRCVVTVFSYTMDTVQESVTWQEEEVAWGDFVSYAIVQAAAELSIQRLVSANKWPGTQHTPTDTPQKLIAGEHEKDWMSWDFVPDGLLVWKAWLQWISETAR